MREKNKGMMLLLMMAVPISKGFSFECEKIWAKYAKNVCVGNLAKISGKPLTKLYIFILYVQAYMYVPRLFILKRIFHQY